MIEVFGVYLAGSVMTGWVVQVLKLQPSNPLSGFRVDISDAALLTASCQLGVLLLLQYGGWFLLIIPINAWHRRRGPAAYGLTRAGCSWSALALAGLGMVALTYWVTLGVSLLNTFYHFGETVPWRQALFDTSWRRWEFWAFMAVASWGGVALLDELFYHGYCQRRLAEDWAIAPLSWGRLVFVCPRAQPVSQARRLQPRHGVELVRAGGRVWRRIRGNAFNRSVLHCPCADQTAARSMWHDPGSVRYRRMPAVVPATHS